MSALCHTLAQYGVAFDYPSMVCVAKGTKTLSTQNLPVFFVIDMCCKMKLIQLTSECSPLV